MLTLNEYFSAVYVLNSDRNPAQLAIISEHLNSLGVSFSRIATVEPHKLPYTLTRHMQEQSNGSKASNVSILLSHYKAIKEAKKNMLKNVLVLGDNINFKTDEHTNGRIYSEMSTIPADYDVMTLGAGDFMAYGVQIGFYNTILEAIEANLARVSWKGDSTSGIQVFEHMMLSLQENHKFYAIDPFQPTLHKSTNLNNLKA